MEPRLRATERRSKGGPEENTGESRAHLAYGSCLLCKCRSESSVGNSWNGKRRVISPGF